MRTTMVDLGKHAHRTQMDQIPMTHIEIRYTDDNGANHIYKTNTGTICINGTAIAAIGEWKHRRTIGETGTQQIAELTRAGYSIPQIAECLGISEATVTNHRRRAGVSQPRVAAPPMSDTELARCKQLLEDGCSYTEVGRTIGRSDRTIAKHFPGHGYNQQQIAEYRKIVKQLNTFDRQRKPQ